MWHGNAAGEEPLRTCSKPRQLVQHHRSVLIEIAFVTLKSDLCVYLYDHNGAKIYLTLYVDDLLLAGNDYNAISMVKWELQTCFKMTDMGEASLVLENGNQEGSRGRYLDYIPRGILQIDP